MAISKKTKRIVAATFLLLLVIAAVVFWPHYSSVYGYYTAQNRLAAVHEETLAEFPEIENFTQLKQSWAGPDNGWPEVQRAKKLFDKLEEQSKNDCDWLSEGHRTVGWEEWDNQELFEKYLSRTTDLREALIAAGQHKVITPTESEDTAGSHLSVLAVPEIRIQMLVILGRQEQAEQEYIEAVALFGKLDSQQALVDSYVTLYARRMLAQRRLFAASPDPRRLINIALGALNLSSFKPKRVMLGEMSGHYQLTKYSEENSFSDTFEYGGMWSGIFDDDPEWGHRWKFTRMIEENMASDAEQYLDVSRKLKSTEPDYLSLKEITVFLSELDRFEFTLIAGREALQRALIMPLNAKLIQVRLKLWELELIHGSLTEHKQLVKGLLTSELPDFEIDWQAEGEFQFVIQPVKRYHDVLQDNSPTLEFRSVLSN